MVVMMKTFYTFDNALYVTMKTVKVNSYLSELLKMYLKLSRLKEVDMHILSRWFNDPMNDL